MKSHYTNIDLNDKIAEKFKWTGTTFPAGGAERARRLICRDH